MGIPCSRRGDSEKELDQVERIVINMAATEVGLGLVRLVMALPIWVYVEVPDDDENHASHRLSIQAGWVGHNQGQEYFYRIGFGFGVDRFFCHLRHVSLVLF